MESAVQVTAEGPQAIREETPEKVLVVAARDGDQHAFAQLYVRHRPRVYALCWRLCGGGETLAGELTQDAFVRAWTKLDSFKGQSAFGTWLHRLTVNVVLSDRRSRLRRAGREDELDPETESGAPASDGGLQLDLEAAIARLPQRARTVLVLHDIEGYRHEDIAKAAAMAVGTSKAQLHRARKLLRQWLDS